jgi:hypothetical protein
MKQANAIKNPAPMARAMSAASFDEKAFVAFSEQQAPSQFVARPGQFGYSSLKRPAWSHALVLCPSNAHGDRAIHLECAGWGK